MIYLLPPHQLPWHFLHPFSPAGCLGSWVYKVHKNEVKLVSCVSMRWHSSIKLWGSVDMHTISQRYLMDWIHYCLQLNVALNSQQRMENFADAHFYPLIWTSVPFYPMVLWSCQSRHWTVQPPVISWRLLGALWLLSTVQVQCFYLQNPFHPLKIFYQCQFCGTVHEKCVCRVWP